MFFLNGVTAIFGWNSVLSSLDYFNFVYQSYNVFLFFPLPCFICATFVSVFYHLISQKILLNKIIIGSSVITSASLVFIVIVSLLATENKIISEDLGFSISIFLLLLIGIFCTALQLSFFTMINHFG